MSIQLLITDLVKHQILMSYWYLIFTVRRHFFGSDDNAPRCCNCRCSRNVYCTTRALPEYLSFLCNSTNMHLSKQRTLALSCKTLSQREKIEKVCWSKTENWILFKKLQQCILLFHLFFFYSLIDDVNCFNFKTAYFKTTYIIHN